VPEESTTPDLVELVRRFDEALNAHDFDALTSFYAPDAVASFGSFGGHEGRAAIRRFYEDFTGAFADFENRFEEIRDLGGGVAFVVFTQRGHPPGGTGWVQVRSGVALTLADGLIERQTNNVDIDEARAAAERLAEERA
jgi:ketosteroid isomerase-like protein